MNGLTHSHLEERIEFAKYLKGCGSLYDVAGVNVRKKIPPFFQKTAEKNQIHFLHRFSKKQQNCFLLFYLDFFLSFSKSSEFFSAVHTCTILRLSFTKYF